MNRTAQPEQLPRSPEWAKLDAAVTELAQRRALIEAFDHNFIVSYLYEALSRPKQSQPQDAQSWQRALARLQDAAARVVSPDRDLVQELIDERREEQRREDLRF